MVKNTFKKGDDVNYTISHQGAPLVNRGYIKEVGKNIVAMEIDLGSKYCEAIFSLYEDNGTTGVVLCATERSLHLNEKTTRDDITTIVFPDFIGWDVFVCEVARYTLSVCLIKKESQPKQQKR